MTAAFKTAPFAVVNSGKSKQQKGPQMNAQTILDP
jgi:hypothetical protein